MLFFFLYFCIVLSQSAVLSDTNCTSAECEGPNLSCPSDSNLEDGKCSCEESLCKPQPTCYDHEQLALVKVGTKVPGDCCDVYECLNRPGTNCSEVKCPDETPNCPTDSYQLPTRWHLGSCCGKFLGCQCLPNACETPSCPDGEVARIVRVGSGTPGSCCPIIQCIKKGTNENCANGTTWMNSDCEKCKCDKGIKFCAKIECPKLPEPCSKTERPKGECCPVCIEESHHTLDDDSKVEDSSSACLLYDGNFLNVGETYFPDPCTNCTCLPGGKKACRTSMCKVPCVNPRYEPGECCPRCDSTGPLMFPECAPLTHCQLKCSNGFVKNEDGCEVCLCEKTQEECVLSCPHNYLLDENGNDLCECAPPPGSEDRCPSLANCTKKCSYGRKRKRGCEMCQCKCPSLNKCEKKCGNGFLTDEHECHLCKCQPSSKDENSACYTAGGVWRDDSEIWRDGCRECHCIGGREMCTLVVCPPLTCEHPLPSNGTQCCSYCPGTTDKTEASVCMDFRGELKLEGQRWTLNDCTDCTCREGQILCYSQQCPPAACSNPTQPEAGNCCPKCGDSDEITALVISNDEGKTDCGDKRNGSSWREGNCVSCRCERGHKICYEQECPQLKTCVKSVLPKNACCPVCLDADSAVSDKGCIDGNMTYRENQEWNLDPCTSCVCKSNNRQCTQRICSIVCNNSIKVPNQCCPMCLDTPPISTTNDSNETSPNKQIKDTLYILLIVLFCVSTMFALYACRQLRIRRNRLRLKDYGCPPPQYQYKYIPTYEDPSRSKPTLEEKISLAPV